MYYIAEPPEKGAPEQHSNGAVYYLADKRVSFTDPLELRIETDSHFIAIGCLIVI